jgi:hypothetical protein
MITYLTTLCEKKQQITAIGANKRAYATLSVPILAYLGWFTKIFTKFASARSQAVAKNLI